ncbi:hypothetical protein ACHAXR_006141 [Thalassiosira sp. AJA248-18]
MAALTRFFISLLIISIGVVESFSLLPNKSISAVKKNNNIPLLQLHARKNDNRRRKAGSNTQKRVPQNKRTATRWVIQGVERCLAAEGTGNDRRGKSYRRRIDASLVDALFLLVDAKSQKDVLVAEKRIQVLMKNPSEFPTEVNERVIKATAMAGLGSLSLSLLKSLLHESSDDIPSPMAYTAVLNILRRNGRIERLEETLADLASTCRRITQKTGKTIGVDIVAFNTYLAALGDAAVNESPFSSAVGEMENDDHFNFTSFTNSTATTSSSEKYLYKALNLLKGSVARTKFALKEDPDIYSYNSVLNAAAKCSKPYFVDHFSDGVMIACLRLMRESGIQPDVLTYNARIQAALDSGAEEAAILLIDQILSDQKVEPDRYTINFMLKPFINAGRRDEVWSILREFYDKNVGSNGRIVSSAFEAFLSTIVQTGEIELAQDIFQAFFLPNPEQKKRMQVSHMIHVMKQEQETDSRGSTESSSRPSPRTRHFNILLGGYSKVYQSVVSKIGKSQMLAVKGDGTFEQLKNITNGTMPDIQRAYKLIDVMLNIAVPLDTYSVSSLMNLPSTSKHITLLLKRIEPEMMVELNPAAYRSIISAYGKAGDSSSACWVFEEMIQSCRNQERHIDSWNALLGALAKGCVGTDRNEPLDIMNSLAAQARRNIEDDESENPLISLLDGKTCLDASMSILDMLRNGTVLPQGSTAPKPTSQTYCLVASSLSGSGTSEESHRALNLFRNAMDNGVPADGRFLNAVLRCFGDDIEGALAAWKSDIGPAAAAYENSNSKNTKRGTNLIAAYNGLMHVCGRAVRPDVATRIAYAMNKANVEPSEVTLNSYFSGKRVTLDGSDNDINKGLRDQYESLLSVECTKYNSEDKRRAKDRKIRIIL